MPINTSQELDEMEIERINYVKNHQVSESIVVNSIAGPGSSGSSEHITAKKPRTPRGGDTPRKKNGSTQKVIYLNV